MRLKSGPAGRPDANHGKVVQENFFTTRPVEEVIEERLTPYKRMSDEELVEKMKNAPELNEDAFWPERELAVIFDLDGTLRDDRHRIHYIEEGDWESYFDAQLQDPLITETLLALTMCEVFGYKILIVTGSTREELIKEWLEKYNINYDLLCFRSPGDQTPNTLLKEQYYWEEIIHKYKTVMVFEDQDTVVKMWQDLGKHVFQVKYGQRTDF